MCWSRIEWYTVTAAVNMGSSKQERCSMYKSNDMHAVLYFAKLLVFLLEFILS